MQGRELSDCNLCDNVTKEHGLISTTTQSNFPAFLGQRTVLFFSNCLAFVDPLHSSNLPLVTAFDNFQVLIIPIC